MTPDIEALLIEAKKQYDLGNANEAESITRKILSEEIPPEYSLRANILLSSACRNTGRVKEGIEYAKKAVELCDRAANSRLLIKAKAELASAFRELGDYPAALSVASSMLTFAQQVNDAQAEASARNILAGIYFDTADYLRSLESSIESLSLLEGMNDPDNNRQKYLVFAGIGNAYQYLGDNSQALEYFLRSSNIAKALGAKRDIMTNLGNIGIVYRNLKNYPKALEYMSQAKDLAEQLEDRTSYAINLGNIGIVLSDDEKYSEALTYLKQALSISIEVGAQRPMGYWMHAIARTHHKLGMLDKAYEGFMCTLDHRRSLPGSKDGIAETMSVLGVVLIDQGKIQEGLAFLREALEVSEGSGAKSTIADSHQAISKALTKQGDLTGALEHYQKFHEVKMSMFNDESRAKIESLTMRVAIEERIKERNMEKMKREQVEKELSSTTMHLAMQTELLANFRNELRNIVREIDEPIAVLKRIKEKLKTLPCEQIDWMKFEKQFTEVHPEFRASLIERYPDLTKQEVKMCQLARLGLKTIEMAQLLCLSERSIESHRYTLRKKLGIPTEQNLTEFLSAIKL